MVTGPLRLGRRVRAARVDGGLSQAALSSLLGISQATLSRIETTGRDVSSAVLARIAHHTGKPIEFFFGPGRPSALLLSSDQSKSEQVLSTLDDFRQFVEDYDMLLEALMLEESAHAREPITLDPAVLATSVRAELKLGDGPVPDVITALERRGVAVFVKPESQGPDGAYLRTSSVAAAYLNGTLTSPRLRETAAHELGHHEYGDEPVLDQVVASASPAPAEGALEWRAEVFAAAFLMPEGGIAARLGLASKSLHAEDALSLAMDFGVTYEAMVRRLFDLRLFNARQRDSLLQDRTAAITPEFRGGNLVPATRLPRHYIQLAFRAYADQHIQLEKLAELLRMNEVSAQRALFDALARNRLLRRDDEARLPRLMPTPRRRAGTRAQRTTRPGTAPVPA